MCIEGESPVANEQVVTKLGLEPLVDSAKRLGFPSKMSSALLCTTLFGLSYADPCGMRTRRDASKRFAKPRRRPVVKLESRFGS